MPLSEIKTPYVRQPLARYQQGDILRDFAVSEVTSASEGEVEVRQRVMPYCVLLSQDCDLEHDFNNRNVKGGTDHDKYLRSVLLCPSYLGDPFRQGEHLGSDQLKMRRIPSDEWKKLKSNQIDRYHYLEPLPDLQVPELVVDFKHYFTVPLEVVYRAEQKSSYLATIEILYREHLSTRFAHYLSRIGLPELTSP